MRNLNEQFVPEWAESALEKSAPIDAEHFKLLREFYDKWLAYHIILNDGKHKDHQRKAGAALIVMHERLQAKIHAHTH